MNPPVDSTSERSPAVTVIIPTYNSSGTLRLTLETVLMQEFRDFEVWVVGDGCTDDSGAVVASYGDHRFYWTNLPSNSGGPSLPRNEGLRRASGRYVAYLGHDDLWFPWHLSGLVDSIEKDGGDLAYSLGVLLGPEGIAGAFALPAEAWDWRSGISPSNWLHRRQLVDAVGPWSLDIKTGHDHDFLERILATDARLARYPQLSVLKFPAMLWRMYSLTSGFPQEPYVQAMRRGAADLRLELLTALAMAMAQQGLRGDRRAGGLRGLVHDLVRHVLTLYGRRRWPVNDILYRRWRLRAGLSPRRRSPAPREHRNGT